MNKLEEQIRNTLLPGMHMPLPLKLLFDWIEENNLYMDRPTGERIGFLFPESDLQDSWTDTERQGGTNIQFHAGGNRDLKYWFGHERPEVLDTLCVFAQTGDEGSMAAFWLPPEGEQKIVHLGSGSGSTMVCTLADDPVDFLRLLAIGYDEICWESEFGAPPNADESFIVHPNVKYQKWVRETFSCDIPSTGMEIVRNPDVMDDKNPRDTFSRWVKENVA